MSADISQFSGKPGYCCITRTKTSIRYAKEMIEIRRERVRVKRYRERERERERGGVKGRERVKGRGIERK